MAIIGRRGTVVKALWAVSCDIMLRLEGSLGDRYGPIRVGVGVLCHWRLGLGTPLVMGTITPLEGDVGVLRVMIGGSMGG
jgi:hypothetical protein